MTASLLFHTLLRRFASVTHWLPQMFAEPPPPASGVDGDEEPDPRPDPPLWTYFIENRHPSDIPSDDEIERL